MLHRIDGTAGLVVGSNPFRKGGIVPRRSRPLLGRIWKLRFVRNPAKRLEKQHKGQKAPHRQPEGSMFKKTPKITTYPALEAVQMECAIQSANELTCQRLSTLLADTHLATGCPSLPWPRSVALAALSQLQVCFSVAALSCW